MRATNQNACVSSQSYCRIVRKLDAWPRIISEKTAHRDYFELFYALNYWSTISFISTLAESWPDKEGSEKLEWSILDDKSDVLPLLSSKHCKIGVLIYLNLQTLIHINFIYCREEGVSHASYLCWILKWNWTGISVEAKNLECIHSQSTTMAMSYISSELWRFCFVFCLNFIEVNGVSKIDERKIAITSW